MNGSDTYLDVNNSHLRVTSGNVYASSFNLDQISIVSSANTATTVNFNNDTKAFNAVSNIEVGTANLFVDTTTSRVGIGTDAPAHTLDVHGSANIGTITTTDINVTGNLTVLGTTTTLDTVNLRVKDPIIEIGKDNTASPVVDLGLILTRPATTSNVAIIFDETTDTLEIGYTQSNASDTDITMRTAATEPLSVNVNGTISGNGSGLTALNATNITTGTLTAARIPVLDAAKITSGTFAQARIPLLSGVTGVFDPNVDDIKIGNGAGTTSQGANSVAVGHDAGKTSQGTQAVAIGRYSGQNNQGNKAVAVGIQAGQSVQGDNAIAVGVQAGVTSQGDNAVAVGYLSGNDTQGTSAVAVGIQAGQSDQGDNAIAIGRYSGQNNQGNKAVAVGYAAGLTDQHANSIILNASGVTLDSGGASRFYVKPVRGGDFAASALAYTAEGEIVEETNIHFDTAGNVGIGTNTPSHALNVKAASGDAEVHIQAQGNNGGDAIIYFNGSSTNQRKCAILSSNVAPNSYCKQDLHFCMETTNDLSDVDITDSKMVITNAGNVGIGTTSPSNKLHVEGAATSGILKRDITAVVSNYNYLLSGPRPGTGGGGAVLFINGSTRTDDGNTNKFTIRNDNGSVDIGSRSETLISNHATAPEPYNAEQRNVDIMLNNGSLWMSPYTARHRDMGTSTANWSQYIGKHYVGRILSGIEIENRNDRSTGTTGVYYSNLLHFRAHDHGVYEGRTMTIRGSRVGVITETPGYTLHVNGDLFYASGGLNGSDDRIKYNEENITNALDIICKLKPQKYEKIMAFPSDAKGSWIPTDENWETVKNAETKPWEGFTHGDEYGFIAQDVRNIPEVSFLVSGSEMKTVDESVSPEEYVNLNEDEQGTYTRKYLYEENVITIEEYTNLISENKDKCTGIYIKQVETQTPLGLNYQGIFVVAVKAIQEIDAQLQAEKAKVTTLQSQLASVLTRLDALENA